MPHLEVHNSWVHPTAEGVGCGLIPRHSKCQNLSLVESLLRAIDATCIKNKYQGVDGGDPSPSDQICSQRPSPFQTEPEKNGASDDKDLYRKQAFQNGFQTAAGGEPGKPGGARSKAPMQASSQAGMGIKNRFENNRIKPGL